MATSAGTATPSASMTPTRPGNLFVYILSLSLEKTIDHPGFVSEEKIAEVYAASLKIPYLDLKHYIVDHAVVKLIAKEQARRLKAKKPMIAK